MIFIFVVDKMNLPIAVVGHEELLNPYNFIRVKPFSHYWNTYQQARLLDTIEKNQRYKRIGVTYKIRLILA